jgi:sodium-dependent dicarboxylate transporter 2/3/5
VSDEARDTPARRGLWLGPLVAALALGLSAWQGLPGPAGWTAAVTALCAVWWILEPIPIPATALVPFAAFPLLGVLTHEEVASAYGHTVILLFLGGFLLSAAMERSGTHRRLAVALLRLVGGTSARRLVLGFMLASWSISMWISNTATVLMLLPMTVAVLERVPDERLAGAVLLGVAYGASIGGLGTPVGSPPNVIYMGIYQQATGRSVGFAEWMSVGVPVAVVFVALAWLLLTRGLRGAHPVELPQPGRWRAAELRTLGVFALTALAWVTREIPVGGWSAWLGVPGAGDSSVALLAALVLFLAPDGRGGRLVAWEDAQRLPWGLLVLFGGGIAIAKAFGASGLSDALGGVLSGIGAWPALWTVLAVCLAVTFLTEVTSNTATATTVLPVLAASAAAAGIEPALLMLPAALSASCAFMLPVATPPNAIVYGTGRVSVRRMAREGLLLNFAGAAVITAVCLLALAR